MTALPWTHDDGGREAAGFLGSTGDCVTRAIAIATGSDYQQVYDDLYERQREWAHSSRSRTAKRLRKRNNGTPRLGVMRAVYEPYLLEEHDFIWTPKMQVGQGVTHHVAVGEVPMQGPVILRLSRHLSAVVDGVLHDTYDTSRDGTRAVYGWFTPKEQA